MGKRGPKAGESARLGFSKAARPSYRVFPRTADVIAKGFNDIEGSDLLDCLTVALDTGLLSESTFCRALEKARKALETEKVMFDGERFKFLPKD